MKHLWAWSSSRLPAGTRKALNASVPACSLPAFSRFLVAFGRAVGVEYGCGGEKSAA